VPVDLDILTPVEFLIGSTPHEFPEPNIENMLANKLSQWQKVQQPIQHVKIR